MLGAIIGDIVGSIYEFNNYRDKDFIFLSNKNFFTDDTVMTVAICDAMLHSKTKKELEENAVLYMQEYGNKYPCSEKISYGINFNEWLKSPNPIPYNSYGNGSAMRISSIPYFASSLEEVKTFSKTVTAVTHNHSEGIKGAEATAVAIWLALNKKSKQEIKEYIENNYYSLDYHYNVLNQYNSFNESCQATVPRAIFCFLISEDFEDAIRTGVSIGGDTDTICAIIGGIAEAFYGIPTKIKKQALTYLDKPLIEVLNQFNKIKKKRL